MCMGLGLSIDGGPATFIKVNTVKVEVVDKFSHLGDMLGQVEVAPMSISAVVKSLHHHHLKSVCPRQANGQTLLCNTSSPNITVLGYLL